MEKTREINVLALLKALLRKAWIIVLCAIIFGIGGYFYTSHFVTPMYQSSILMYVNNTTKTDTQGISSADLATSQRLVRTYLIILQSNPVMEKVAQNLQQATGVQLSGGQIRGMVSADAVNETEVFSVSVTNADPVLAAQIANAIAAVSPTEIETVIRGSTAKVVQEATIPGAPSSPNVRQRTELAAAIGVVIAAACIILRELMDVRIKCEADLVLISDAPILGIIPELAQESDSQYAYAHTASENQSDEEVAK